MSYGIKLLVWGDYASFNRPEMKVERVSYDVITPSAARGILESIYWKPEMQWVVDRIHVLKPIQFTQIRRNEISEKASFSNAQRAMKAGRGNLGIAVDSVRQQRAAQVLKDVCYGIEAHVVVVDNSENLSNPEAKHLDQFKRRAKKGACFHHPYLGCREFPAEFELIGKVPEVPEELRKTLDLGYMLHDMQYEENGEGEIIESNNGRRVRAEARFFRVQMINGIIDVPDINETRG